LKALLCVPHNKKAARDQAASRHIIAKKLLPKEIADRPDGAIPKRSNRFAIYPPIVLQARALRIRAARYQLVIAPGLYDGEPLAVARYPLIYPHYTTPYSRFR
jgi:hypothetical protein